MVTGMIYASVMQAIYKFKVYNACVVLKTHHEHCSPVHGPDDDGVNYTIRDLRPLNITSASVQ